MDWTASRERTPTLELPPPAPQRGRPRDRAYRRLLALTDLLVVAAAGGWSFADVGDEVLPGVVLLGASFLALAKLANLYDGDALVLRRGVLDEVPTLAQLAGISVLITLLVSDSFWGSSLGPRHTALLWLLIAGGYRPDAYGSTRGAAASSAAGALSRPGEPCHGRQPRPAPEFEQHAERRGGAEASAAAGSLQRPRGPEPGGRRARPVPEGAPHRTGHRGAGRGRCRRRGARRNSQARVGGREDQRRATHARGRRSIHGP